MREAKEACALELLWPHAELDTAKRHEVMVDLYRGLSGDDAPHEPLIAESLKAAERRNYVQNSPGLWDATEFCRWLAEPPLGGRPAAPRQLEEPLTRYTTTPRTIPESATVLPAPSPSLAPPVQHEELHSESPRAAMSAVFDRLSHSGAGVMNRSHLVCALHMAGVDISSDHARKVIAAYRDAYPPESVPEPGEFADVVRQIQNPWSLLDVQAARAAAVESAKQAIKRMEDEASLRALRVESHHRIALQSARAATARAAAALEEASIEAGVWRRKHAYVAGAAEGELERASEEKAREWDAYMQAIQDGQDWAERANEAVDIYEALDEEQPMWEAWQRAKERRWNGYHPNELAMMDPERRAAAQREMRWKAFERQQEELHAARAREQERLDAERQRRQEQMRGMLRERRRTAPPPPRAFHEDEGAHTPASITNVIVGPDEQDADNPVVEEAPVDHLEVYLRQVDAEPKDASTEMTADPYGGQPLVPLGEDVGIQATNEMGVQFPEPEEESPAAPASEPVDAAEEEEAKDGEPLEEANAIEASPGEEAPAADPPADGEKEEGK